MNSGRKTNILGTRIESHYANAIKCFTHIHTTIYVRLTCRKMCSLYYQKSVAILIFLMSLVFYHLYLLLLKLTKLGETQEVIEKDKPNRPPCKIYNECLFLLRVGAKRKTTQTRRCHVYTPCYKSEAKYTAKIFVTRCFGFPSSFTV